MSTEGSTTYAKCGNCHWFKKLPPTVIDRGAGVCQWPVPLPIAAFLNDLEYSADGSGCDMGVNEAWTSCGCWKALL